MSEELHPTALVVDDFADSRRIVRRLLEMRGFRVAEAADGVEAVEAARLQCPDLVLMDLNMPGMDGLEAAQKMREQTEECENIVLIAFTAYHTYGMKEAAIAAGFDEYVVKPIIFDDLDRVLRDLLPGLQS